MTTIGNLALGLTSFLFFYFIGVIYGPRPPQSGDAAMGYPITVIFMHLLLLAGMTIVVLMIGWKGGFEWVSPSKSNRIVLVGLGLSGIILVSAFTALLKYESGPIPFPYRLKAFTYIVPVLFPVVLIVTSAILLNKGVLDAIPLSVVKIPLVVTLSLATIGIMGVIGGWMKESAKNAERTAVAYQQSQERLLQNHLDVIAACDSASFQVANILCFTTIYQNPVVREKALAKIYSNPNWQEYLIFLIENNASVEVFHFLAHNDVPDKALFAQPVYRATLNMAEYFRETIRRASHPSHLYEGQFYNDVERVLQTLKKFKDASTDYLPAVRAMRAALDEPSEYKQVKFQVIKTLDKWIAKNS